MIKGQSDCTVWYFGLFWLKWFPWFAVRVWKEQKQRQRAFLPDDYQRKVPGILLAYQIVNCRAE